MSDQNAPARQDAARVGEIVARYRAPVLDAMRAALDRPGIEHIRYMRYHLGWEDSEGNPIESGAGKMLRPALCLLACEAAGGSVERALPAAAAIELLHNFTLIHDDIEDSSETRHGRPTLWTVAGIPQAINAGDGMFVIAQRTLLDLAGAGVPTDRVLAASRMLNDACVTLCEGQYADLSFESRSRVTSGDYESMIGGKTAALLGAAAAIGALAGGADDVTIGAFALFGQRLGLAFQIHDDLLGIWGEPNSTGKSASDDIRAMKKSFPIVYTMEHLDLERRVEFERIYAGDVGEAEVGAVLALLDAAGARDAATKQAGSWSEAAIDAIGPLDLKPARRAEIEALARFAVTRNG